MSDSEKNIIRLDSKHLLGKDMHIKTSSDFSDIGLHWHSYCELIYYYSGELQSTINGTPVVLEENVLYLLSPTDLHHTVIKDANKPFRYVNISFTENLIDKNLLSDLDSAYYIPSCSEKQKLLIFLIQTAESEAERCHLLNALLHHVIKPEYKMNKGQHSVLNHHISNCIRFLQENFNQPIQLTDVARHLHLSPEYLSTLFSQTCGCTFKKYLIDYRLSYAKELLKNTDKTISEICFSSGFSNLTNFLKSFKQHTGQTPSQYKASLERMSDAKAN